MKQKMNLRQELDLTRDGTAEMTRWCIIIALHQCFGVGKDRLNRIELRAEELGLESLNIAMQANGKGMPSTDQSRAMRDNWMPEGVEPDHWNMEGFRNYFIGLIAGSLLQLEDDELKKVDRKELGEQIKEKVHQLYAKREEELGENITRELERVVLLKQVDTKWMDHIDAMDELKKGISLRSYGQKDPVVEYRIEGFDMFDEMIAGIREETVKILLLAPFRKPNAPMPQEAPKREQVAHA